MTKRVQGRIVQGEIVLNPPKPQEMPQISNNTFNPINPTVSLRKASQRAASVVNEYQKNRDGFKVVVKKADFKGNLFCRGEHGDFEIPHTLNDEQWKSAINEIRVVSTNQRLY